MRSIWHYYKTYFLKVYVSVLRNITKVLHYLQVQSFRKIFSTFIFFIRRGNTQNVRFFFKFWQTQSSEVGRNWVFLEHEDQTIKLQLIQFRRPRIQTISGPAP